MKSLLASKPPKIVAGVLNGDISILIFKKFPKDYRGWVYFYCTKDKKDYLCKPNEWGMPYPMAYALGGKCCKNYNGKVLARFYCDNVEEQPENTPIDSYVFKQGCLRVSDIVKYCECKTFYAIHISQLEIFDKPKELWEFMLYTPIWKKSPTGKHYKHIQVTKAPSNYMYVETE